MGLDRIRLAFETNATTAVERSGRGVVVLIVSDKKNALIDKKVIKKISELNYEDFEEKNIKQIKRALLGSPEKVLVLKISEDENGLNMGLQKLEKENFDYLAIPDIGKKSMDIALWIKSIRKEMQKGKVVLPKCEADHEGIINFDADEIVDKEDNKYTAAEYCSRIAGVLAGLPFTRSATNYKLEEVKSVKYIENPNEEIKKGKLILIEDEGDIVIAEGVNSFVTVNPKKGEQFKSIRVVEAIDLIKTDIKTTFKKYYRGKCNNGYAEKLLLITSINGYFKQLKKEGILDANFKAMVEIDVESIKIYLESRGIDIQGMAEQDIKEYPTQKRVFLKGTMAVLDAMEELDLTMLVA